MRRLLLPAFVALAMVGGLAAALALRPHARGPIVASVPVGAIQAPIAVDARAGRAFILDDGVLDRKISFDTRPDGSIDYAHYTDILGAWGNNPFDAPTLRIIDTRAGRQIGAVPVDGTLRMLAADQYTGRLFAFAFGQQGGSIQVFDARSGASLGTVPYNGDAAAYASVADARSGRLFVVAGPSPVFVTTGPSPLPAPSAAPAHVLMLDGRTGAVLRTLTLPVAAYAAAGRCRPAYTLFQPCFSLVADPDRGHIYLFDDDQQRMIVLDGRSGRVLFRRHLPAPLDAVALDARTDHIFALDASRDPLVTGRPRAGSADQQGAVLMLDARTGALLRRVPGGSIEPGDGTLAIDARLGRVLVANPADDSVGILDAATGRLLRTVPLGAMPWRIALDQRRRRAFVLTASGTRDGVTVLSTRDGTVLRTTSLQTGHEPIYLTVDDGTGYLIATSSAARPAQTDRWAWLPGWLRGHLPWVPPPPAGYDPSLGILAHHLELMDPAQ